MKKFKVIFLVLTILTMGGVLSACGVGKDSSSDTQATSSSEKTVKSYMADLKEQGLTVTDQEDVEIANLAKQVKATSGVRFNGESGTHAKLLQFNTEDLAQKASSFYANQGQQVYAEGHLLLVMDRSLGKGWFKKYQKAIFNQ